MPAKKMVAKKMPLKKPAPPKCCCEKRPFQAAVEIRVPNGFGGENGSVTVPKGKRLVIEYVSGEAFLPTGQKGLFSVIVSLQGQAAGTRHYLESIPMGKFGAPDYFRAGQVVRLYADQGTNVMLRIDRDIAAGDGLARMSLSGHLVDT